MPGELTRSAQGKSWLIFRRPSGQAHFRSCCFAAARSRPGLKALPRRMTARSCHSRRRLRQALPRRGCRIRSISGALTRAICPKDAPNILIILLDDVGFGQASTFGGDDQYADAERLANQGISYNTFHTTSICSPTRAALLTGRNHQRVGNGTIAERAVDWDGYTGVIPKTSATMPKVLRFYGYNTAAFGKWHNTPANQTTAMGPFDVGRRDMASTTSTASSPARPRSGSRGFSRIPTRWNHRTTKNTT